MKKSVKVSVEELQIGNFIKLPVSWKDHPFLFSSFKLKQDAQIELIKRLGISHVFIDLERSEVQLDTEQPVQDPTPPKAANDLDSLAKEMNQYKSERIDVHQKMRRQLRKTEQEFDRSVSKMRSVVSKLRSRPLNAVNDAKELIHDMSEQLLNSDNLVLHLMGDAKDDEGIYYHSLNVAILSMLMAKELGWSRTDIELVGIGSLFHDTGKLKVPASILKKKTPLTLPEKNFFKQHPVMGEKMLQLAENFPSEAIPIILNHHEHIDGSGFPRGLKEKSLDKLSQLVAVINTYDMLCHPDAQSKPRTPYAALGYMFKHFKTKLNQQYTGSLIKMLGIYPPGSIVELSSGQFAMVMAVNLNKLLFPRILAYDAMIPKEQAPIVDLEAEGLTIVRCIPPAALPEKVYKYLNPRERVSYFFGQNS